jgi:hypothetical protein
MLVGVTAAVVGLQSFFLGIVAQVLFDYNGHASRRWLRLFPYTRSVLGAALILGSGIVCTVPLIVYYFAHDERLSLAAHVQDGLAVTGLLLTVIGASLFTFTLVLHATVIATRRSSARFKRDS